MPGNQARPWADRDQFRRQVGAPDQIEHQHAMRAEGLSEACEVSRVLRGERLLPVRSLQFRALDENHSIFALRKLGGQEVRCGLQQWACRYDRNAKFGAVRVQNGPTDQERRSKTADERCHGSGLRKKFKIVFKSIEVPCLASFRQCRDHAIR